MLFCLEDQIYVWALEIEACVGGDIEQSSSWKVHVGFEKLCVQKSHRRVEIVENDEHQNL